MSSSDAYVMLMSSLPKPGPLFVAKQTPLSRLKLNMRLRVLTPEEKEMLKLVEQALLWRQLPMEVSDRLVIDRGRTALSRIDNETLQSIVRDRLEIRTCVAALRRRSRGEGPPPAGNAWGFGRWVGHIARNWSDPAFALQGVFPWLHEADRLMARNDSIALERLLLSEAYKRLQRLEGEHAFDFEAVVIYVLKWSIVDRWARYNAEAAARRFEDLTETGLADYAALSFEGDVR
ncbi:hypothetical protein [Algihabitans albus]|uniref:hypothetical protein n=1 Tax=Algihabitans albus TaxID=2164067 RepID=UPI000E5D01FC|nr:hypothetical protein [Algihabitans albus]